jgi:hypothetical protein
VKLEKQLRAARSKEKILPRLSFVVATAIAQEGSS